MAIPLIIGGVIALGGLIGKAISRAKANKKMRELEKQQPVYQENPLAAERTRMARNLLNARMPGSVFAQQQQQANQASAFANVERAATDSSQALMLGSAIQAQGNQDAAGLANMEAQDYYNRFGILSQAQQGEIVEGDKKFAGQQYNWSNKAGINAAIAQNNAATWQSISNFGMAVASYGSGAGGGGGGSRGNVGVQSVGGQYMGNFSDRSVPGYGMRAPSSIRTP